MKRLTIALAAGALALSGLATAQTRDTAARPAPFGPVAYDASKETELRRMGAAVLFWSREERFRKFRAMQDIFPTHVVQAGSRTRPLPAGPALPIAEGDVEAYMTGQGATGILVLQNGKVRLERYAFGFGPGQRWTSFSVAKSFTSTLVGAAVRDGYIKSLDDPVTRYMPELAGSGYDGVSVRQLLTMSSGVRWNEDYADAGSDVARLYLQSTPPGSDPTITYMRNLPREAAPGTRWHYNTGETNLIGVLVSRATGRSLAAYLSEKIWRPHGMESDAYWQIDGNAAAPQDIGGCCLAVTLRDYARFGQFVLGGGQGVVPDGWFAEATQPRFTVGAEGAGFGYGYQWWTYPGSRFGAQGIFGQSITFDPATKTVVVMVGNWPTATGPQLSAARLAFLNKLFAAAAR